MWKQQLHIPYCTLYHQRAKMRYSVEIVLVIFGCAITLTTARSITQASHTRTVRSPAEDDPAGTPQAIRAKPENTKGYIAFAKNNFQGIDDIMDKHFSKKKEEGENIIKAGEETQVVVKSGTDTMEKEHYDLMQKAFEGFNTARSSALEELMQGEDDLSSGGSGSGASAKPAATPPKNPDWDSDEAGAKTPDAAAPAAEAPPAEAPPAEAPAEAEDDDD